MGRATAHNTATSVTATPSEAVPAEVYDGMDFDEFNRNVAEYRALTREHGFEAALSHYAGEPVAVRGGRKL